MKNLERLLSLLLGILSILLSPALVFPQAPFYQGKTITLIRGEAAGGTGDLMMRAEIPFLRKYIPGEPAIVVEYMPGGGGRAAANHFSGAVRPDGLTMGSFGLGLLANAALGESGVQYDVNKFIYLGSPHSTYQWVLLSRKEAGLDNLEKLRAASGVRVGAQSVGHAIYITGRLFAYLIGLKDPKFVVGYSGNEIDLALARGEVDMRVNNADTVLTRSREAVEKGLIHFHATIEVPKGHTHPHFAQLPEMESFARSQPERGIVTLLRSMRQFGSPFLLPPGTPKDRVEILQEAFRKTFKDPEFIASYNKMTADEASPILGSDMSKILAELPRDPQVIALFKKIAGPDPLPAR
jgi:tripartite-type tricarboxylate transporter receptor subunit TctC